MGTGIVAVALALAGFETLFRALLGIAAATWLAAAAVLGAALVRRRAPPGIRAARALTAVAGTCVLGSGLELVGWSGLALALWIAGAALWCGLGAGAAMARPWPRGGLAFLPAVATQSVAVLGAALASPLDQDWMVVVALALLGLGVGLYVAALAWFDLSELRSGGGETWIAGGALAISALACAEIVRAIDAQGVMTGAADGLSGLDLALWIASVAWLPVLIGAELRRPRPRYDPSRWATVFPVGMYAASSFATGAAIGAAGITDFARVWVWVAVATWCLAALGLVRRAIAAAIVAGD